MLEKDIEKYLIFAAAQAAQKFLQQNESKERQFAAAQAAQKYC